jgi:hypothetical protein
VKESAETVAMPVELVDFLARMLAGAIVGDRETSRIGAEVQETAVPLTEIEIAIAEAIADALVADFLADSHGTVPSRGGTNRNG